MIDVTEWIERGVSPLVLFKRNRDIVVHRDFNPANTPRAIAVGDVIRDRLFPLAIFRVLSIDEERVALTEDDFVMRRHLLKTFVHADGAPISGVES